MNIGIMTHHRAHNYGAMLQAYALQYYIKNNITTEVKIIDFKTEVAIKSYNIFKKPRKFRGYIWELLKLFHYRELRDNYNSFEEFLDEYIDKTDRYSSYECLLNKPPEFDYYISGSDQVFSPKGKELNAYYLNFGHENIKRVAYAPSFGYKTVPDDRKKLVTRLLNQFDYLSSREISGCRIIKELTGKEVPNVLDPVFLLDLEQYLDIAKPINIEHKQYILCYSLVGMKKQIPLARKLKELIGLPIVLLRSSALLPVKGVDIIIRTAGPREFLWLFLNASYVITDSFHGTAFSLVFKKNFFSTIAFPEKAERIYSVLNEIGLGERIIDKPDQIRRSSLAIDYELPIKRLDDKIRVSKDYLHKVL